MSDAIQGEEGEERKEGEEGEEGEEATCLCEEGLQGDPLVRCYPPTVPGDCSCTRYV